MWHEYLGKLAGKIGGQLAAALAGVLAVVALIFGHRHKVRKAETQGKQDGAALERDRIRRDTEQAQDYLEQRADEIEREINDSTADPDDLRQRMRAGARDRSAKP